MGLVILTGLLRYDPKAESKLLLKLDLFIVPTVSILYLFCFIDRANIGNFPHPVRKRLRAR